MKNKRTKIAELKAKLTEAIAGQAHNYYHASAALPKTSTDHLTGSGVVLTVTALGGRKLIGSVVIRDGLSQETIRGLGSDIVRSYKLTTIWKPTQPEEDQQ